MRVEQKNLSWICFPVNRQRVSFWFVCFKTLCKKNTLGKSLYPLPQTSSISPLSVSPQKQVKFSLLKQEWPLQPLRKISRGWKVIFDGGEDRGYVRALNTTLHDHFVCFGGLLFCDKGGTDNDRPSPAFQLKPGKLSALSSSARPVHLP